MASALGTLALRMGFASQELAYVQQHVWDATRMWDEEAMDRTDVVDIMATLSEVLIGLRAYLSDFQAEEFGKIRTRTIGRHEIATEYLDKMFDDAVDQAPTYEDAKALFVNNLKQGTTVDGWKTWQKEDWTCICDLMMVALRGDQRLVAWFQIGERSAKALFDTFSRKSTPPDFDLAHIYAPMNILRGEERRAAQGLIPYHYSDAFDLVITLWGTFNALCKLLDEHESDLLAVPQWDGSDLVFRGKRASVSVWAGSATSIILTLFQEKGWPDTITVPATSAAGVQIKNARFELNKKGILKFSQNGFSISWSGDIRPKSE